MVQMALSEARLADPGAPVEPPPGLRFRRRVRFRPAMVELYRSRELLRTLVERDLRIRYKQTILGFGWAVIGPVMLMLVFSVFFEGATHIATGNVPYPIFSYLGLVPWTFFSEAVSIGSLSLITNLVLLNKVYCPREVFPIGACISSAFDALISTVVLVVIFGAYQFVPSVAALWLLLLIPILVVFTMGVTLLTASVLVYLRDMRYVVPMIVQVGLFASPVAYQTSFIPSGLQPLYAILNPIAPIINDIRRTVLHGQAPDWGLLGLAAGASVVWLVVGYRVFKRLEVGIADFA
jgi:ABC-type polysaccharide/polyol phosphate export permease